MIARINGIRVGGCPATAVGDGDRHGHVPGGGQFFAGREGCRRIGNAIQRGTVGRNGTPINARRCNSCRERTQGFHMGTNGLRVVAAALRLAGVCAEMLGDDLGRLRAEDAVHLELDADYSDYRNNAESLVFHGLLPDPVAFPTRSLAGLCASAR